MKLNVDEIEKSKGRQLQGSGIRLNFNAVEPDTPEVDETEVVKDKRRGLGGKIKDFITYDAMIDEEEYDEASEALEEVIEKSSGVVKRVALTGVGFALAIGITTYGGVTLINKSEFNKIPVSAEIVTNKDHLAILNGDELDFDRLLGIYDSSDVEDIVVNSPDVSMEALQERIERQSQEITRLKDLMANASSENSDPNEIPSAPETTIVEVPTHDKTNEKIQSLEAQLKAAEVRERAAQKELDKYRNGTGANE